MATRGFDVTITGLAEVVSALGRFPVEVKAATARGLRAGVMLLVREVQRTIYDGHAAGHLEGDKGHLRRSITYAVDEAAGEASAGTNVVYAPVHEFGATIKARNAPYLRFEVGKGPDRHWVSVREVTIPARPFLQPAFKAKGDEAADKVRNAIYEVLQP